MKYSNEWDKVTIFFFLSYDCLFLFSLSSPCSFSGIGFVHMCGVNLAFSSKIVVHTNYLVGLLEYELQRNAILSFT